MLCFLDGGRGSILFLIIILVFYYMIVPSTVILGIASYIMCYIEVDNQLSISQSDLEIILIILLFAISIPFALIKNLQTMRYLGYIIGFLNLSILLTFVIISIMNPIQTSHESQASLIEYVPTFCTAFEY